MNKNTERRDYIPLALKLKKGDKVDIEFNIFGEKRLMHEQKSVYDMASCHLLLPMN